MREVWLEKIRSIIIIILIIFVSCDRHKRAEKFFSKAYYFLALKEADSALFYVNKGLKLQYENALAHNMKGAIYHLFFEKTKDTGYILMEIKEYQKALEIDSNLWESYINLGVALYIYGRKKESVPYLRKGLKLNPTYGAREKVEKMIEEGSKVK